MNSVDKWVRGCLGKKRYRSLTFAEKIAHKVWLERSQVLRVYSCATCSGFHLTKQIANKRMVNEKSF